MPQKLAFLKSQYSSVKHNRIQSFYIFHNDWNKIQNWLMYEETGKHHLHMCAVLTCPSLWWPHGLQPTRLLCPWGFSRQEYGSGLPFPPSGDLPDPGIKPRSPASPALAGRFFYHLANPKYSSCVCESPSVMSLCDPKDCSPPGSSIHGDFPGKNTGVGCHALLQEIFPTQGPESRSPTLQVDSLPFEPPGTLIKKNSKLSSFDSCLSDILSIADFQAQPTTV